MGIFKRASNKIMILIKFIKKENSVHDLIVLHFIFICCMYIFMYMHEIIYISILLLLYS